MARTTLRFLIFVLYALPILAAFVRETPTLDADAIDISVRKEDSPTLPGTPLNNAPIEKPPNIPPKQGDPPTTDEDNESKPSDKKITPKIERLKEPEIDKPQKGREWKFDHYLVQKGGKTKTPTPEAKKSTKIQPKG